MARGGFRTGAGRPKGARQSSKKVVAAEKALKVGRKFATALDFAMDVINDPAADMNDRVRLAVAVLPFQHAKIAEQVPGKKEQKSEKAKEVARGRFAPPSPPKLIVNNA